ncbi:homoserine/homoserine lactone efflux protein [Balneatrix alpica]|uniref:homoserine/homoserine lactone efflux protein n=1 Tax=Balneatrix alpica TaxID=75684 RepID=UPI0027391CEF|nr:homoserine/homoserine lactone efflux protein [Balneatrix alpica]
MSLSLWLTFLVATLVLSISPGAGAVNTMSNALRFGVVGSLPSILGLQVGLAVLVVVVGAGLGAIVATSAMAFTLIKWAGVAYLIYLGVQKWREVGELDWQSASVSRQAGKQFYQACLVNITNPKSIVFLVALFPQFIELQAPQLPQYAILGSTMVVVDTVVMLGFASLAARLRVFFQQPERLRWQNRIFGGFFVGAGGLLATARL